MGFARTRVQAEHALDELVHECLRHRTDWPVAPPPAPADPLPLPSVCAVAEALDHLAQAATDPSIYTLARSQLAAGVPAAFDGVTRWVDGLTVTVAPVGERWPWPWRCSCGQWPYWHGALCDALLLAADQLADERLPFEP